MSAETYWNLLVLFGVLCQGIIGTLAEKDIDESSELLVRQKRVINRDPRGDIREPIRNVPHVVMVKGYRSRYSCVGAILSQNIVLTVAGCVDLDISLCRVYSGTGLRPNIRSSNHFKKHNVTDRREFMDNHNSRSAERIALITVTPHFVYSINTQYIKLYEGPTHPGLYGTVSGWGCNDGGHPGTAHPDYLRSIRVPIISNQDCATLYVDKFTILNSDICTFDSTGNQYCGVQDAGAPLVISHGYEIKLAGIHIWNGGVGGAMNPDVFVNLQYPTYKTWITQNMHLLNQIHHA